MPEPYPRLQVDAACVRPAMELALVHALEQGARDRTPVPAVENSYDPAHELE
jgi:hypothetical protein